MAKVIVNFHGLIARHYMEQEAEISVPPGTTVKGVIMHFAGSQQDLTGCKFVRSLGENALNNHMVTINGMGLTSERWSAIEVKDGDRIFIFLPVTGG